MAAYDFNTTFHEFVETDWSSTRTRARRQLWLDVRDDARARWARVLALRAKNLPYTDAVLDGMLPYAETATNRAHNRWLHPSSTLATSVRPWFEREGWTLPSDWPLATFAVVQFIERCLLCPERLQEMCDRFMHGAEVRGFQSSLLSPMLNALVPDRYLVVNARALATLRAFTGVPWSPRIETYPKVNDALAGFIDEHRAVLESMTGEGYRPSDVLDLFSQWFASIAPELLEEPWERVQNAASEAREVPCWKVAPGEHAQRWFKCLANQSISFAWHELGDISQLTREDFLARVEALSLTSDAYCDTGVEHLWHIARAPIGAVLVAARGTTQVIGVGRVTGPYRHTSGDGFPHRVEVDWFDPGERAVSQPGWTRTLAIVDPRWVEEALDVSFSGVHSRNPDEPREQAATAENVAVMALASSGEGAMVYAAPSNASAPTLLLDHAEEGWIAQAGAMQRVSATSSASVEPRVSLRRAHDDDTPSPRKGTRTSALTRCAEETGYGEDELRRWVEAIRRKGQAIVSGPTGTGKTFLARHLARYLAGGDGVVEQLQFHAGYRYDDFIERRDGDRASGNFLEFLVKARDRVSPSVLVIDEIHRADLARVLGEALHALEYRGQPVRLASGTELVVPRNVLVLGTMNAADRVITVADQSLRRRFAFIALPPRYDVLASYLAARGFDATGLIATLQSLNRALVVPAASLGTASFFRDDLATALEDVWTHEVEPHVDHHFGGDAASLDPWRWERVRPSVLGER